MNEKCDPANEAEGVPCLILPDPPADLTGPVKAWEQDVEILTYAPGKPDRNPMFLEKRVYQGSSGRVYPLPFIDRISTSSEFKAWKAIHIENDFLRLMILPEIGGRIHVGYDKVTGYDFFYRQNVIKPALVGLAGPWISGGVEFNWPQHHRPATFMPVQTEIENHTDGSITVWSSDHDPMLRMKGMHGVRLHPDKAVVELWVRLFNRTQFTQTFLWWANVATRVHERYQSFFPTDVRYVADHARRAVTSFPQSDGQYYGVDYRARARSGVPADQTPSKFVPDGSYPANDLSWYANIPVPTSYMVSKTCQDFFGGYDHKAEAGVVHVADHHIAPGKKQWTWGNHEFGYAWDRSLTDCDGPYIELMAGAYTENQPDFSYLAPWETKAFVQTWFPIHSIGVPRVATSDGALSLKIRDKRLHIGVAVTHCLGPAKVLIRKKGVDWNLWVGKLCVSKPLILSYEIGSGCLDEFSACVESGGKILLEHDPSKVVAAPSPNVAREPAPPEEIVNVEELFLTGVHLQQYRHATRHPELYWREALRRDPGESRSLNAMGLWHLGRGEFEEAVRHFDRAIQRLTTLNPNPYDGQPYYNLGMAKRFLGLDFEAYDAFYKATWSAAWRAAAFFAIAELEAKRKEWNKALDHVRQSLNSEAENLNALNLLAYLQDMKSEEWEASATRERILAIDALDGGARWAAGIHPASGQETLDLAFDLLRSGRVQCAATLLEAVGTEATDGSAPMLAYVRATISKGPGSPKSEPVCKSSHHMSLDYCFPSRLEELLVLQDILVDHPDDASAHYLLGNLLCDRRRYEDAMNEWKASADINPTFATVWRNLGIALFNAQHNEIAAKEAFDKALLADLADARILYERDQLWKRLGESPERRLKELLEHVSLVRARDDLSVELATLYNQVGQPTDALSILNGRNFQPWEGGEGLVLRQYVRAHLLTGRQLLVEGQANRAIEHFMDALSIPQNLGEGKHLFANQSDIYYWLGTAHANLADQSNSTDWWERAARQRCDFLQMSLRAVSDMTYWSALAMNRLGRHDESAQLFQKIYDYSALLESLEPKIDYFATSLPAMLLFEEDLKFRNQIDAKFLRAQALVGKGRRSDAEEILCNITSLDSNHAGAVDLLKELEAQRGSIATK